jgi:hypothetical protein
MIFHYFAIMGENSMFLFIEKKCCYEWISFGVVALLMSESSLTQLRVCKFEKKKDAKWKESSNERGKVFFPPLVFINLNLQQTWLVCVWRNKVPCLWSTTFWTAVPATFYTYLMRTHKLFYICINLYSPLHCINKHGVENNHNGIRHQVL